MTKISNGCQSFRITAKALKLLGTIFVLCTFQKINLYLGGLAGFKGGTSGKFGLKGEISHFPRAFEGNTSEQSLNGWEALNYIFLDQKFPSGFGENFKIIHFETIFQLIPQF